MDRRAFFRNAFLGCVALKAKPEILAPVKRRLRLVEIPTIEELMNRYNCDIYKAKLHQKFIIEREEITFKWVDSILREDG